ncbi:MAG: hypothetical protein VKS61_03450 [Candidatus Sericytochromatia bacterium]|nr:hypothetical protein [Candidatus Sericytochromatia bacterium]
MALTFGCTEAVRRPLGTAFVLGGPPEGPGAAAAGAVGGGPGAVGGLAGAPTTPFAVGGGGPASGPTPAPEAVAPAAEVPAVGGATGRVVALVDGEPRPVAAAWVATSAGLRVQAGPDGRFRWEGAGPADGVWLAGAPGHFTSVVQGAGAEVPATLHLEPLAVTRGWAPLPATRSVTLAGRVVDAAGQGRPGLVVVLGGPGVAGSPAATTDATGRYALTAALPVAGLASATLLAAGLQGGELGLLRSVALPVGLQALPDLVVAPATLALRVAASAPPGLGALQATLTLRAPDGTRLGLVDAGEGFNLAEVSGVSLDLHLESVSADGLAYSRVERPGLRLDWAAREVTWREALLPPVSLDPPPVLAVGGDLGWPAVPGAGGYTVRVAGPRQGEGWPWEAFTPTPAIRLLQPLGGLEPGPWTLEVTAWDAPGLAPRALMQARSLRRVDGSAGLRVSGRRIDALPL